MSHLTQRTQGADERKADICCLLEWTEQEYCNLQFENGLLYLSLYLKNDTYSVDLIKHCRVFWSWWRNHWAIRNNEFFIYVDQTTLSRDQRRIFYDLLNDPQDLAKAIRPNGIVLQNTYAYMMGQLIDQTLTP